MAKAISQALSIVIVIVIVAAAAFGGYAVSSVGQKTSTSYETSTQTVTSTPAQATTTTTQTAIADTATFTTTVYKNVELVGICTAISYFLADTSTEYATTVTITSGNSTYYSLSTNVVSPSTTTIGTTTYSTSTYGNVTTIYTITTTSQNLIDIPSDGWTVTTCTLSPT